MHSPHATTVEAGLADGDQRTGKRDPVLLGRSKLLDRAKAHTLPLAWVVVFCVAYILPGLTGHDPWKPDEAYIFGSVYHMVQTGDWVVPYVAGEPFMEKPPLFQAVAATLAKLASPMLPLHHGARLASGLFVTFTLLALSWSARRGWGAGYGRRAALLLLSSVGLIVYAHMMLPDLALMAGFAVAVAGLVACAKRHRWGGLLLGLGAGMGFLAKGLIAPGVIGVTALALPIAFRDWRRSDYFRQLGMAALSALPWLTIWPATLYLRSPDLFKVWFWDNNIGRFLGFSVSYLGANSEPGFWWKTYPWFLFPLWVFVVAVFWKLRRDALRQPAVQVGVMLAATLGLVLGVSASAREIYALPILVPLALVGAGAIEELPRWIERSLLTLGVALGVAAVTFFWPVWASLVIHGHAPDWPWLTRSLPQQFAMPVSLIGVSAATLLTIGAVSWITITWRKLGGGLHAWCASLTLVWGLAATLWLPWLDAAKSYRVMYQSMGMALPARMTCLASYNLGESERAMLDYVLGIDTFRQQTTFRSACNAMLIQDNLTNPRAVRDPAWILVWSGARLGDSRERFQLYAADDEPSRLAPH